MTSDKYQLVSIYLNEADKWEHHPLDLEILKFLYHSGCAGGTVLRGLAGFTKGGGIVTTSLVDVGSKLPVVVHFVEKVRESGRSDAYPATDGWQAADHRAGNSGCPR